MTAQNAGEPSLSCGSLTVDTRHSPCFNAFTRRVGPCPFAAVRAVSHRWTLAASCLFALAITARVTGAFAPVGAEVPQAPGSQQQPAAPQGASPAPQAS